MHLLLILSERYDENAQVDRWQATLDRAFSASRGLADVELRSRAACAKARGLGDQQRFALADLLLATALADLAGAPDAGAAEAFCLTSESSIAARKGDGVRAVSAAERAVAIEENRRGTSGPEIGPLLTLANAYLVAERAAAADKAYRRVLAVLESHGLERTRDAALVLSNWSVMLQNSGQYVQAVPMAERAVAIARERDTENGPAPLTLRTLATALCHVGRCAEAATLLEEAVIKARRSGSSRRLVDVLSATATSYREVGDFARAVRALRGSRERAGGGSARSQPGPRPPGWTRALRTWPSRAAGSRKPSIWLAAGSAARMTRFAIPSRPCTSRWSWRTRRSRPVISARP